MLQSDSSVSSNFPSSKKSFLLSSIIVSFSAQSETSNGDSLANRWFHQTLQNVSESARKSLHVGVGRLRSLTKLNKRNLSSEIWANKWLSKQAAFRSYCLRTSQRAHEKQSTHGWWCNRKYKFYLWMEPDEKRLASLIKIFFFVRLFFLFWEFRIKRKTICFEKSFRNDLKLVLLAHDMEFKVIGRNRFANSNESTLSIPPKQVKTR